VHSLASRRISRAILTFATSIAVAAPLAAQTQAGSPSAPKDPTAKKVLVPDDYTRWRSIGGQSLSGDGKWVTYVYSFTNTAPADAKPVLHLLNLGTNQDVEVANASGPAFSNDSKWLAYQVDPASAGRGGRGGRGGGAPPAGGAAPAGGQNGRAGQGAPPAPPRRVELRNLETGNVQSWQDIQSFTFAGTSSHLILRRRSPGGGAGAGGGRAGGAPGAAPAENAAATRGGDVILHDLTTGRDQLLGSVGEIGFNKKGDLLAYTVEATPKDGNGLFVLDLASGRINPLDNDARTYARMTWNDAGTGLAVLKGVEVDKMRERDNTLLVYRDIKSAITDPQQLIGPVSTIAAEQG